MKAYLLEEFGGALAPREVDDPQPTGKEVVVDVVSSGLCHTDLHFQDGYLDLGGGAHLDLTNVGFQLPAALGHEVYGVIADFGPDSGLTDDDRDRAVIVYPWLGCGECPACLAGAGNTCAAPSQIGIQRWGGYAEKVMVPEARFLVDATGIDPVLAGSYACSGLTSYSALKKLGPLQDQWIAIVGLGGVGLMGLAVAKGIGFEHVLAIDIDDEKLAIARDEYGADRTLNAKDEGLVETIQSELGGVAGVVDFVGSTATAAQGAGLLHGGGVYVCVGLFGGELRFPLPALNVQQLQFKGSFTGTLPELQELMAYVREGRVKPIPAQPVPFADVNESFRQLREGHVSGRLVLTHGAPVAAAASPAKGG